ncbi:alkane 1-monooxygenase [Rhodosalinus halophilus]|uniref:Alkane 1-monooxygenase n=1 Tax=Rhodosalinus halophilus TaxID=2259333 RepID=A0A365UCE3_9RHOB|nr:alkane 1-monooxygenase [Rhodosalinus halophilus]RBI86991.1 alkane 1-monooxygenase [Rhodosalinus halophilus]
MVRFALATLAPALMLALAVLAGGMWGALALLWMTVLTFALDRISGQSAPAGGGHGRWLTVTLGLVHLALWPLAVWGIGGPSGLSALERGVAFFGFGVFFGQVSNSVAHELIHAAARPLRRLGATIYVSLLFGHHVSAHRLVHHVHVATARDPNSAPFGMSYWAFLPRAWWGSFREGWRAEEAMRARRTGPRGLHPYAVWLAGGAAAAALAALIAGPGGLAALAGLAAYAQAQLLLSDYVQHYGLRRRAGADGRAEPAGPQHAWNAPHRQSAAMMLNAPRHSDHHAHPGRPWPELALDAGMPVLPQSLPVMATIALWPPAWRALMDRRVARVMGRAPRGGDAPGRRSAAETA